MLNTLFLFAGVCMCKSMLLVVLSVGILGASFPAYSVGDDVKQVIIKRCRSQMQQYGAMMVKSCVDQDIDAVSAIESYSDEYAAIVGRCMGQMAGYGFVMVKACADQDIAAEKALADY